MAASLRDEIQKYLENGDIPSAHNDSVLLEHLVRRLIADELVEYAEMLPHATPGERCGIRRAADAVRNR